MDNTTKKGRKEEVKRKRDPRGRKEGRKGGRQNLEYLLKYLTLIFTLSYKVSYHTALVTSRFQNYKYNTVRLSQ